MSSMGGRLGQSPFAKPRPLLLVAFAVLVYVTLSARCATVRSKDLSDWRCVGAVGARTNPDWPHLLRLPAGGQTHSWCGG